jgi:transketolase
MSAAFYRLDNLTAILDRNRLQATGTVKERFNTNPLNEKWISFGWHVIECDGHDMEDIIRSLDEADRVRGKPVVIIANTVKGKCVSFAENNPSFHNGMMTDEQYKTALKELGGR